MFYFDVVPEEESHGVSADQLFEGQEHAHFQRVLYELLRKVVAIEETGFESRLTVLEQNLLQTGQGGAAYLGVVEVPVVEFLDRAQFDEVLLLDESFVHESSDLRELFFQSHHFGVHFLQALTDFLELDSACVVILVQGDYALDDSLVVVSRLLLDSRVIAQSRYQILFMVTLVQIQEGTELFHDIFRFALGAPLVDVVVEFPKIADVL